MTYLLILNTLIYIYSSLYRRNMKRKYLLCGLIQDHHIIPRQLRNKIDYKTSALIDNIDSSNNLIMLPTRYGKLFLNTNRSIHENGHQYYNQYINSLIQQGYSIDYIILFVRNQIRYGIVKMLI